MTNFIFNFIRSSAGVLLSRIFGLIRDVAIGVVFGKKFFFFQIVKHKQIKRQNYT